MWVEIVYHDWSKRGPSKLNHGFLGQNVKVCPMSSWGLAWLLGPSGQEATVLATEAVGVPLSFTNGVDVDQVTGRWSPVSLLVFRLLCRLSPEMAHQLQLTVLLAFSNFSVAYSKWQRVVNSQKQQDTVDRTLRALCWPWRLGHNVCSKQIPHRFQTFIYMLHYIL